MHWLMSSSHGLIQLIGNHNYLALFLLILVEEAGCPLPLPGESLIIYAGSRIARHEMSALRVFAAVVPASAIGCTVLYFLARTGGRALVRKMGHRIRLDEAKLDRMEAKAKRIGPVAVLIGRLTPGIRVPTDVAAGIFRIKFRYYLPFALLATCIRLTLFLYVGASAQHLRGAIRLTRDANFLTASAVLLGVAAIAWFSWRHFRPRSRPRPAPPALSMDGPAAPSI
jgi:membrane protein DedA with SNARE-associated domain